MKIDFDLLEKMVAAGANGAVLLAFLREQDAKAEPKRKKDAARVKAKRKRQAATSSDVAATSGDIERHPATNDDTPRARIFVLRPRVAALGLSLERAGQMLGQWAKLTRDNAVAIEDAIGQAERKQPADAIGFIRACLQKRNEVNGDGLNAAFDRIIEGTSGEIASDPPMRDITPRGS